MIWLFSIHCVVGVSANPSSDEAIRRTAASCLRILEHIAENHKSEGDIQIPEMSALERRIFLSLKRRAQRQIDREVRRNRGFNLVELDIKNIGTNDPRISGIPRDFFRRVVDELAAAGGELRLSSRQENYFRLERDRPIIVISQYSGYLELMHEFQHFLDWRVAREKLILSGVSTSLAGVDAFVRLSGSRGSHGIERRAVAAEVDHLKSEVQDILNRGIPDREGLLEMLTPSMFFQFETYPQMEQLQRIIVIQRQIDRLKYRVTVWPKDRAKLKVELDELSRVVVDNMMTRANDLRQKLVTQHIELAEIADKAGETEVAKSHRIVARDLEVVLLLDQILPSDSKLLRDAPELKEFIRSKLDMKKFGPGLAAIDERERDLIEKVINYKTSRANFFASYRGTLESEYLDVSGLGFSDHDDTKVRVSSGILNREIDRPIIDVDEIRQRQDAIRAIMANEAQLLKELRSVYTSDDSVRWRRKFFNKSQISFQPDDFVLHAVWDVAESGRRFSKLLASYRDAVELTRFYLEWIDEFFKEVQKIRVLLASSKSSRLRQLKWVLDSAFEPDHPYGIKEKLDPFFNTDSLQERAQLSSSLRNDHTLDPVFRAYAELASYFDIAENAQAHGWTTFPTILDRSDEIGPVIRIQSLHAPRVQTKNPSHSVSNSIDVSASGVGHLILTGPNGKGKSTFLRAIAQEIILAQMGSPVPADFAEQTPIEVRAFVHPTDSPRDDLSLFMTQARALITNIYAQAKDNPFTLAIMDEILPGTIPEIREDVETEFLDMLSKLGGLSITATHNWGTRAKANLGLDKEPAANHGWGTTSLEKAAPERFRNFHVDEYRVKPGAAFDLTAMYEGAIEALRKIGWPEDSLERSGFEGFLEVQPFAQQKIKPTII